MGAQRTRGNDGSLRDAMDLLVRLNTNDDSEVGSVRGIFTDKQRPDVQALIDRYYGTGRENASTGQLALVGSENSMLLQASRILTEVHERNRSGVPFLIGQEEKEIQQALDAIRTPPAAQRRRASRATIRWPQHARWVWIVAAVLVVLAIIVPAGLILYGPGETPHQPAVVQGPPAVDNNQAPGNTNLQNVEAVWGPWETVSPTDQNPATNSPAFLLLKESGSQVASTKWLVPFQTGVWGIQPTSNISRLSVEGDYVKLVSNTDQVFWVHVNQAFIFEQTPGQVYSVDQTGRVWNLDIATAVGIRQPLTH